MTRIFGSSGIILCDGNSHPTQDRAIGVRYPGSPGVGCELPSHKVIKLAAGVRLSSLITCEDQVTLLDRKSDFQSFSLFLVFEANHEPTAMASHPTKFWSS